MNRFRIVAAAAAAVLLAIAAVPRLVVAQQDNSLKADLSGYQEVPAVSTAASGSFRGHIAPDDNSFTFELKYEGLEGTATASHIHLGQAGVNGGVSVFLCGVPAPACTTPGGTFSGTITAANVIGPAGQGIAAGQFAELLRAIRAGVTYVNVHSTTWLGGEIRGQIN